VYVCLCYNVTDVKVREAVRAGARDIADLGRQTGAGTDCGQCREQLAALIAEMSAASQPENRRVRRN
jgi:assimilatory nitrate reductase catalytic subunit